MHRKANRRKWRNFLIRNDIQLHLAIYNLIFLVFVIGVVIATALVPLYAGFQSSDNLWAQYFSAKYFIVILERLMMAFAGIFIFAFIYYVVVTHRFCGPLVNFGKTFDKIARGDLCCKVHLRRNDFLKREAHQVNEMIDALAVRLNALRDNNRQLRKNVEKLMSSDPKWAPSEQSLAEIKKLADACGQTLDQFNISEIAPPAAGNPVANWALHSEIECMSRQEISPTAGPADSTP